MMLDQKRQVEFNGVVYETFHGAPFDRGSADSWYSRPRSPHWYPQGTGNGQRMERQDMTVEEIEAYYAGYDQNEQFGDKKQWD